MRRPNIVKSLFAGLLVALFLVGCATSSTIPSRIQERYAQYATLTSDFQTAINQGRILPGMSMDAVYMAWGNPSQVVSSGNQAGEAITWLYQGTFLQQTQYIGYRHVYYSTTPGTYTKAQVVFVNGKVTQWQTFPAPY